MSGYPIRRDIVLRGDSASLVHRKDFHRRLELLFNVHVKVDTQLYKGRSGDEEVVESDGWVTVRGKSEEDCLKTQKYVLASSNPECRVLVPCGPQLLKLLFEDKPALRDHIEREYEVLIVAALNDGGLYIQGSRLSVHTAVTRIHSLADTIPPAPSDQYRIPKLEPEHRKLLFRDPFPASCKKPQLQKVVDQYVQLGFPTEQVQGVIESLGMGASENDIMSRLVLVNSATRPPPTMAPSPVLSKEGLRPIVIDGSNVAMKHGNGKVFSCKGIEIALNHFLGRGHSDITIFVPQWRKEPSKPETPIKDQEILLQLENAGYVKFTPSRRFGNRKIVCYDDRFIVQLAYEKGGIIVSTDNFRDLFDENPLWRETIEKRVLQFVFVEDSFMVPQDPLGKHGPRLDNFLRFERGLSPNRDSSSDQHVIPTDKTPCPYKDKCTFGRRCRYYHPERESKLRDKESHEDPSVSSNTARPNNLDQHDELSKRMKQLLLSPQKLPPDMPGHQERPGGLRHTHPLVGQCNYNPALISTERDSNTPYCRTAPHDQWSGRSREEHKVMSTTMARGISDRMYEPSPVEVYPSYSDAPLTMPYNPYQQHHQSPHVHSRPRTHPQILPPQVQQHHSDYHHSHYSLHGNERQGYTANIPATNRPHSVNMIGYSTNYSSYKDPRELDQIQSLDSNQRLIYDRAVELYPQHSDRALALIVQFHISDLNTLIKALGK